MAENEQYSEKCTKYNTRQRDEILDCLKKNQNAHLTADDIYEHLKKNGKAVGKTTVYRYLDTLCGNGELLKYSAGEKQPSCYQLGGNECKHHYHLVCVKCGRLIHTQCNEIDEFISHFANEHDFVVDMTRTTLYGVCGSCKNKGENNA